MGLLLVDHDLIFRLGIRTWLAQFEELAVVAEAETGAIALEILQERSPDGTITAVMLGVGATETAIAEALQLSQQIKQTYFQLPVVWVGVPQTPAVLAAAQAVGVSGYCPRTADAAQILATLRRIQAGKTAWLLEPGGSLVPAAALSSRHLLSWQQRLRASGLRQMDTQMTQLASQLQNARLSPLTRAVLAGRYREVRAARWLVSHLLPTPSAALAPRAGKSGAKGDRLSAASMSLPKAEPRGEIQSLRAMLLDVTYLKIQGGLQNQTETPLEIDILQAAKRQELLYLILRRLDGLLDELRLSDVQPDQLPEKRSQILRDLWQSGITDFFGKYYTLQLPDLGMVDVVPVLLQDWDIVEAAILDRIPFVAECLSHLLFQTPLPVNGNLVAAGTPAAMERVEILLQNWVIQVANAVMQPLLNHFADVEEIKETLYDRRLMSTREIERFRNDLSWRYRTERNFREPQAIFESRYRLYSFSGYGIKLTTIYAPRSQELSQLRGLRLAVTIALEARDAIAPRLRATVAFLGSGVVYLLTQVVGRGIGLVGRGILQGLGSAWQDGRYQGGDRPK